MGVFDATWVAAMLAAATPLLLAGMGELIYSGPGSITAGPEGWFLLAASFAS